LYYVKFNIYIWIYRAKCRVPVPNRHRCLVLAVNAILSRTYFPWSSRPSSFPLPNSIHLNSLWGSLFCFIFIRWLNYFKSLISILSNIVRCALALSPITLFLTLSCEYFFWSSQVQGAICKALSLYFISAFIHTTLPWYSTDSTIFFLYVFGLV